MLRTFICSLTKELTYDVGLSLLVWPSGAGNRHGVPEAVSCAHIAPGRIPAQSNPPPGGRQTAAFKAQKKLLLLLLLLLSPLAHR